MGAIEPTSAHIRGRSRVGEGRRDLRPKPNAAMQGRWAGIGARSRNGRTFSDRPRCADRGGVRSDETHASRLMAHISVGRDGGSMRSLRSMLVVGSAICVMVAGAGSALAGGNPPGNNGTVKVDGIAVRDVTGERARTWDARSRSTSSGSMKARYTGTATFELQPPTGNGVLLVDSTFIGGDRGRRRHGPGRHPERRPVGSHRGRREPPRTRTRASTSG